MKLSPVITGAVLCHIAITAAFSQSSRPPQAVLNATSEAFGTQEVGVSSTARVIVLTNPGGAALSVASVSLTGMSTDFSMKTTCGTTVAPGSSCSFTLTFTPSMVGPRSAAISIVENGASSPLSISLTGTGALPQAVISATAIPFPLVLVGSSFYATPLTIANPGNVPLSLSASVAGAAPADYQIVNSCSSSVPAAGKCSIGVYFKPTALGSRSATLTISGNAPTLPVNIPLTGTGGAPQAVLDVTSLDFGTTAIRSTGASLNVTLSNPGTLPLTGIAFSLTGAASSDFRYSQTCGASLAVNARCTISITFVPNTAGQRNATLSIAQNATSAPLAVSLTGTATAPQPVLSPQSVSFGPTPLGSETSAATVTLFNQGTASLPISGVALSGAVTDFQQTNTCGTTLAPKASCQFAIVFKPVVAGIRNAAVAISGNFVGSPLLIAASGTATTPQAVLSAYSFAFAAQPVGTSSPQSSLTIRNTGTANLTVSNAILSGTAAADFQASNGCKGVPVAPNSQCRIGILFDPTAGGTRTASLTISTNAPGTLQPVTLTGTAIVPQVLLDRTALTFGTSSADREVTVTNNGAAPLSDVALSIQGPGAFAVVTNGCTSGLPPKSSCTITVSFTPALEPALLHGWLLLSDNAPGSPQRVDLVGGVSSYSFKELSVLNCSPTAGLLPRGLKMNSNGQAVGYCLVPTTSGLFTQWPWESPDIGSFDEQVSLGMQARSINDSGTMVEWQGGLSYTNYDTVNHFVPYRTLPLIRGNDINNSGWVAGVSTTTQTIANFKAAFYAPAGWQSAGLNAQAPSNNVTVIGSLAGATGFGYATSLDDAGTVAGFSGTPGYTGDYVSTEPVTHAFKFNSPARSGIYDLGTLPGFKSSFAFDTKGGYTVGTSSTGYGFDAQVTKWLCFEKFQPNPNACSSESVEAFIHTDATGMTGLGQIGGTQSVAYAVNRSGIVVGTALIAPGSWHGFFYALNAVVDLNFLLATPLGDTLTEAVSINQSSQILANGTAGRVYILTPEP